MLRQTQSHTNGHARQFEYKIICWLDERKSREKQSMRCGEYIHGCIFVVPSSFPIPMDKWISLAISYRIVTKTLALSLFYTHTHIHIYINTQKPISPIFMWGVSGFAPLLLIFFLSQKEKMKYFMYSFNMQNVDKCTNEKDESVNLILLAIQEAITTDNTRVKRSE